MNISLSPSGSTTLPLPSSVTYLSEFFKNIFFVFMKIVICNHILQGNFRRLYIENSFFNVAYTFYCIGDSFFSELTVNRAGFDSGEVSAALFLQQLLLSLFRQNGSRTVSPNFDEILIIL